jgi:hypothetical protein
MECLGKGQRGKKIEDFLLVKKWLESRAPEDKSFMTMPPVPF